MAANGSAAGPDDHGLVSSAKGLVTNVIAAIETRLALLGIEIQEERIRVTRLLIWGAVGLYCLFQGITLFALFLLVLFWESNRLAVLGLMCGGFIGLGVAIAAGVAISARKPKSRPFAGTLEVLAKDRQQLDPSKNDQ